MSDTADVVVVGGGIMGLTHAVHLLEAGVEKVHLIERDGLCEGTTGAGGGFLAPWTVISHLHGPDSPAGPLERYGMEFYAKLNAAGHDIDYRQNGVLWVTASEGTWALAQSLAWDVADAAAVAVEPGRMAEFSAGVVSGDGVYGGYYVPSGAQISTTKVGTALAARIRELGGVVETRRPAEAIRVSGGRVTGVDTAFGRIDSDHVVLAAGAWSNQLLEPLGAFLPAVPQITSRIITEDLGIPETLPMLFMLGLAPDEPGGGTPLWVRWHDGGLLWGGMYGTYPRDVLADAPIPDRLDELPTDGILEDQRMARGAAGFMPVLSRPASIRVKHGAPCYTPDNLALVGPVPGIEGLHALGGDNELGVTQGPGLGKVLADHIVHGTSELAELGPWCLDRFGDRYTNAAEAYAGLTESLTKLLESD
ncbi:FAD-binding oxidoreductase [Amycolatopsis sp. NPDC051716]|jgi:sarcosine oxidase subunit beta|uniref:NAD(P)/FAD-dependent oxidoreductase n=1 Tax=Amycolatopsis sp. NPDC051716 TaxID=3155804 RepID=UPI00342CF5E8